MGIWKVPATVEQLNERMKVNMMEHLDITFTELGDDYLKATMPVDHRTQQPFGLLHGGASAVLSETLGSLAGSLCIDMNTHYVVGLQVNANHLRSVKSGRVTGHCRPIHVGRSTQVWETEIFDEDNNLVCVSRLTLAVMSNK